jgi:hypothetical protein
MEYQEYPWRHPKIELEVRPQMGSSANVKRILILILKMIDLLL